MVVPERVLPGVDGTVIEEDATEAVSDTAEPFPDVRLNRDIISWRAGVLTRREDCMGDGDAEEEKECRTWDVDGTAGTCC